MPKSEQILKGISVTRRSAIGVVRILGESTPRSVSAVEVGDSRTELLKFDAALARSREQLEALRDAGNSTEAGDIVEGQLLILADPEVIRGVIQLIKKERWGALRAVDQVIDTLCQKFSELDDAYLAAREADLQDVGQRIRKNLTGVDPNEFVGVGENTILVARELAPTTVVQLEGLPVAGLVMDAGAATSHAAILARGLDVPCLVGVNGVLQVAKNGDEMLVDGVAGEAVLHPSEETRATREERLAQPSPDSSPGSSPEGLRTVDGQRVFLRANISLGGEVRSLETFGAEGVGLFRTEMLYMGRARAPSVAQQLRSYRRALQGAQNQIVTFRTFDAGGDKDLPFMHPPEEENPALGIRALRLSLREGKVLKNQFRALLRASPEGRMRIMVPMVTTLTELQQATSVLEEVKTELEAAGEPFDKGLRLGMMVEVPAAALRLSDFLDHVEFFSVGSNDMMQFLFAADRGHPGVAHLLDGAHPAFLQLMEGIVEKAREGDKPLSVCGELPADPVCFTLLLGLGVREFSMNLFAVPRIREIASRIDTRDLEGLIQEALRLTDAASVRARVQEYLAVFS